MRLLESRAKDRLKPSVSTLTAAAFAGGLLLGVLLATGIDFARSAHEEPDIAHYREVRDFVSESFVREVDHEQLLDRALHGLTEGLDPYSRYYDREETAELERDMEGRYTGIGAVFKQPIAQGRILFTLPGSPAAQAGLRVGDRLVEIDGVATSTLDEERMRALLGDAQRDILHLVVQGLDGVQRPAQVKRASIVDPTVRHERMLDPERKIGYLAITTFSHETAAEFDQAFERLRARGMRALLLDLRNNPGGVLGAAVDIARRFIADGVIVSTEGRGQPIVHRAVPAEAWYRGFPLVLLVDGGSASASEVLAAALQDRRAAVITGSATYGKGMVQTIRHFTEAQAIAKVTTSYYYTPAHRNLERSLEPDREFGIAPDIAIRLSAAERQTIHDFLAHYSPPPDALPALKAWEAAESVTLIEAQPQDPQIDAALALFAGKKPGPYPAAELP